jgi:hypothetical protein
VAVLGLAAALLAARAARVLPSSSVRVPLGPDGWSPRTFVNTSLALPLESTGQPLRIALRASAGVRSALLVHVGGVRVGDVLIGTREPQEYVVAVPAPAAGQRLDLALAAAPRPVVRRDDLEQTVVVMEALEIASPRGLVLGPRACLLVACWPIAALAFAWLRRWPPAWAAAAAWFSAGLAVLLAHAVPLHLVHLTPTLILVTLGVGLLARFPLTVGEMKLVGDAAVWRWAAVLAAIPAVETSLLLYAFFRRSLLDHVPGFINDAIDYWLEAQAFAHAGFRGGYFTIDERPAPASFSHFGSHGPLFPMIHGTLGRLLGWRPYSIPVFHLLFLTAGLLLFARFVSLDRRGRVLTALTVAVFWPIVFFLPTSLQEGLHLSLAVLFATAFRILLDRREASRIVPIGLLATLAAATLVRPSWGLLLPTALVLALGAAPWRRRLLAAAAGMALWAALVAAFSFTAAPFGRKEFFFVKVARLQEGASSLLARCVTNAALFVQAGTALEVRSRFLVLGLALAAGVMALRARPRRELVFHAYNLGSVLLAALLTYVFGQWGDYRLLSAHLLLTLLLLASSHDAALRRLAALALVIQLGSLGPFLTAFRGLEPSYRYDAARIDEFGVQARRALRFDARQDAWCNTLVSVNPPYFYPEMVALPPGLGVTMLFGSGEGRRPPLRSRYVLLDPEDRGRWSLGAPTVTRVGADRVRVSVGDWLTLDLKPLASTPVGQLYENLDARCSGG